MRLSRAPAQIIVTQCRRRRTTREPQSGIRTTSTVSDQRLLAGVWVSRVIVCVGCVYTATLLTYGNDNGFTTMEVTPTEHGAIMRFQFPAAEANADTAGRH